MATPSIWESYTKNIGQLDMSQSDAEARLANDARQYSIFGPGNSTSWFNGKQGAYDAYTKGDVNAFDSSLGAPVPRTQDPMYRASDHQMQGSAAAAAAASGKVLQDPWATTPGGPAAPAGGPAAPQGGAAGALRGSPFSLGPTAATQPGVPAAPAAVPAGGSPFSLGPTAQPGALAAVNPAAAPSTLAPAGGVTTGAASALPTSLTGAATYTPNDSSLVARQLQTLLASDSPYVQRARTRAAEYANSRGALNSSIAAGAGEGAAIDAAMPIAQADASAHLGSLRDNANALNQFGAAGNAYQYTGALANQNAGITATRDAAQFGYQTQLNAQGAAINTARDSAQFANRLTEMTAATDEQIRLMDKQQGTNLYASYRTASESIQNDYAAAIQAIQVSDMDADVKTAQIANLQNLTVARQNFLSTIYSNSPGWSADWAKFAVEVSGG